MESFFRKIAVEVHEKMGSLYDVLDKSSLPTNTKNSVKSGLAARMSKVNEALTDTAFRNAVWDSFNISREVEFIELPGSLLYGDVSSSVHLPGLSVIYVSDATPLAGRFYESVSKAMKSSKKVLFFSEEEAAYSSDNDVI